jgi:hypothetical protein
VKFAHGAVGTKAVGWESKTSLALFDVARFLPVA